MSEAPDRIEAALDEAERLGRRQSAKLLKLIRDARLEHTALVEIARAARRAERKLKYEYDRLGLRDGYTPPEDESWAEGEKLAAALARLDDNHT